MIRRDRHSKNGQIPSYLKVALIGSAITSGAVAYASLIEPRTLLVREIDVSLPTLPASLDGTTYAFLSDLHLGGPGDPLASVQRALSVLEARRPDLIFLGGDYYDRGVRVDGEPEWSRFPQIARTLAVPGNHDYHRGMRTTEAIFEKLRSSGIEVLRNEVRDVPIRDTTLRIIGLDDPYTDRASLADAMAQVADDRRPRIMLAHAGLIADKLPVGSADLILSGHTHGAQIRFSPLKRTSPLDIFWWLDLIKGNPLSPYRQGLFRVRGSLLYVGNGLGTTSLGLRFMAPPEIAFFRLTSGTGNDERACDDPSRFISQNQSTWHVTLSPDGKPIPPD
jgi:uncharacterized protein